MKRIKWNFCDALHVIWENIIWISNSKFAGKFLSNQQIICRVKSTYQGKILSLENISTVMALLRSLNEGSLHKLSTQNNY